MKNRVKYHSYPSNENEIKKSYDWAHIYGGAPVPPIAIGSFNYLIWDILKINNHIAFLKYYKKSFENIKECKSTIIQIDFDKKKNFIDRVKTKFFNKDHLPTQIRSFLNLVTKKINSIEVKNIMLWGDYRYISYLRKRFPNKRIVYALRFFQEENIISSVHYNYLDDLVVLSKGIARHNFNRFFKLNPIIHIIPNGIETNIFKPISDEKKASIKKNFKIEKDKFIIFFPSKLENRRGVNYLIRWSEYFLKANENIIFICYRNKTLQSTVKNKINQQGQNIIFIENLPRKQTPKLYQISDICILPTTAIEGMSMSALEAMSSALPCVVSKRGIYHELIKHNETGLLCDLDNMYLQGIKHIERLYKDNTLRNKLGENARVFCKNNLSRDKCLNNWNLFFESKYDEINSTF